MSGRRAAKWCGAVVAALAGAVTGSPAASAAPDLHRAPAPILHWGATWIQSLDPPHAPAAAGESSTPGSAVVPPDVILSNERTFTRWAYVADVQTIYAVPSRSARAVGRLHWYTEDGFSEIYLLLRAHWDSAGREWVELRIPGRPNGQVGWVRRRALGAFHLTRTLIVVNRARLRMYLYVAGRERWSAPVGIGTPATPTPTGHFWIRERFKILDPSSGYYPYAFGTADYSTLSDWPRGGVVGIHGPYYDPEGIPGQISHGCIRLGVADDAWLAAHIGLGTPLRVV